MIKISLALILFLFDFITKMSVSYSIEINEFVFLTSFLDLVHIQNFGVSFGLFSGTISPNLLVFFGFVVSVIIFFMMHYASNNIEKWGYLIILIGAFSNIFDRMINGHVIDFIYFHYKDFYWPAFNFADIYISIGVSIIVFQILTDLKKRVFK